MHRRPSLLIVDDTLSAQCLQQLVVSDFPGVRIVSDLKTLLDVIATSKPDLVLIDLMMPGLRAFDVVRRIREISPGTKVLVVTMHDEPQFVAAAFGAGASGYVLKCCAVSELAHAIQASLNGQPFLTDSLRLRLAKAVNSKSHSNGNGLTLRQREVLQLVALGRTAKEIANALGVSVKTAVFHKMAVMDKLGLRTTAELTRYALEHGILSEKTPGSPAGASRSTLSTSRSA